MILARRPVGVGLAVLAAASDGHEGFAAVFALWHRYILLGDYLGGRHPAGNGRQPAEEIVGYHVAYHLTYQAKMRLESVIVVYIYYNSIYTKS